MAALRVSFRDAIPAQPQDSRFKAAESASKGAQSALSMLRGGCPKQTSKSRDLLLGIEHRTLVVTRTHARAGHH
jgi:hypothetical protein